MTGKEGRKYTQIAGYSSTPSDDQVNPDGTLPVFRVGTDVYWGCPVLTSDIGRNIILVLVH